MVDVMNEIIVQNGSRLVKAIKVNNKIAYKDEHFSRITGVPTYFNEDGRYTYNFLFDVIEKVPLLKGMGDDSAGHCHPLLCKGE